VKEKYILKWTAVVTMKYENLMPLLLQRCSDVKKLAMRFLKGGEQLLIACNLNGKLVQESGTRVGR
jgi:hypothetical protein